MNIHTPNLPTHIVDLGIVMNIHTPHLPTHIVMNIHTPNRPMSLLTLDSCVILI